MILSKLNSAQKHFIVLSQKDEVFEALNLGNKKSSNNSEDR